MVDSMAKPETLRCCECNRPLVNRLTDHCLYCGAKLDEKMILSTEEKNRLLKKETEKLRAERAARIEKEKARDSNPIDSTGLGHGWMFWGLF